MSAMSKLIHLSTIDVAADQIAGVGAIPSPTGPPRIRLFMSGGGVIDVAETRDEVRALWLGTDSDEARYSRLVEGNYALRSLFDRIATLAAGAHPQSPRDDLANIIKTINTLLLSYPRD